MKKQKRILAGVTAAAILCCGGICSDLPWSALRSETVSAAVVTNDFERNYDGWIGSDFDVMLNACAEGAYGEGRGMVVTGRDAVSDGATSDKSFYLSGGVKYDYSVKVSAAADQIFRLLLTYQEGENGASVTVELDVKSVSADCWETLSASYRAPKNACNMQVSIVTDSTDDFCFDAFSVTTEMKENNTVSAAAYEKGLKDAFAGYFKVGNILNSGTVRNGTITDSMLKDYNSIECENEMKPDGTMVQSQSSGTNVAATINGAAAIMDFCVQNNLGLRGHVLVWHSQTPSWFFRQNFDNNGAFVDKSTMDARMESYIKNLFGLIKNQYPDLNLYAYDVVNEAVSDDANRTANYGGAREPGDAKITSGTSAWVSVYGDNSFIEKAFRYARQYAPEGCALYYNDYNEYWDHKRDCIYNMCKDLYSKGLLDGIGMQSHINANYEGFSGMTAYKAALQKYASIGCEVQITELDISIENGTYTLQQQADKYKAVFQAAMDINTGNYPGKVTAVCMWGPNDANTWISTENAPLLYNTNHQPKPAYTTLMEMIPESQWGNGSLVIEPDANGWFYHSTYEGDLDEWQGRGDATVMTSGRTAYDGSEAMLVQNRSEAWHGAYRVLNTAAFKPGEEFSFSANVSYFDGPATDTFYMKLEYTDANGDAQYSSIAEGTCVQGEWLQLANTNYRIPADARNPRIYIETASTTNNFYVDEAIGAVAGTVIPGAGAQKLIIGDVNADGSITAADLSLAKRGYKNGFASSIAKLAADVDQSGVVDTADLELMAQFITCQIDEFPVAERVVDVAAMEKIFSSVSLAESWKKLGENNALYTQRFGADPGFMVYNDRLYVFMTNDAFEYDSNGNMKENSYDVQEINCISSADLVNWTDHGAIPVAGSNGAAKWAFASWAPDACWKNINGKDKFFLYFCNSAGGIGVLTADSPIGPWTDPIGKALVTKQTANCGDVEWLFDPAVFVDDDGSGYLYFGGGIPSGQQADPGTARAVKLGADMTSLDGTPVRMNPPYLFEDSSMLKIGNTYYYSYCTNFQVPAGQAFGGGEICYMTSNNPLGPFTFGGRMFKNPASFGLDKGGNNHHSLVEFKGNYYLLYHARAIENRMGISLNYRSPHIDSASVSNGAITVTGTMNGVSQLETLNPYNKVQAETIYRQAGINVKGVGDTVITDVQAGDWIGVSDAAFTKGAASLTVRVASKNGAAIKVCSGSENGTVIGYVDVAATGSSFTEITVPVNNVTGTQDIYFVFSNELELDWWQFS